MKTVFHFVQAGFLDNVLSRPETRFNARAGRHTTVVFIKLWRDIKHSVINRYFAFVVN